MWTIKLPIRRMVEFLLRSGSIDARAGGGFDRAQEGSRIHRRLQKEGGADYRAEVPLAMEISCGDFCYTLEGRADGVLTDHANGGRTVIDEIKTTHQPIEFVTENGNPAHWAQACCYGYILCAQESLPGVTVRLTYVQADTGELRRFYRDYTREMLETETMTLLRRYERWARLDAEWHDRRNESLHALTFPFGAYRAGQREMAAAVYRTIAAGERLFCCAPTGIGKTMSTVFPALKAMGGGMGDQLFYLTAKTMTARAAEEALARLRVHCPELKLRAITLTAKDKICMLDERSCTPDACPYADGYFDRANDAVYALLTAGQPLTRETITAAAAQYRLCPYELSLDLSVWCDCVICDYNYLLDPVVHLQRFFDGRGDYIFLLDEAHNAVDRCRDMYSAALRKSDFLAFKKALPKTERSLRRAAGCVNDALLELRRQCEAQGGRYRADKAFPEALRAPVQKFLAAADRWLEDHRGTRPEVEAQLLPLYFDARFFMKIAEDFDDTYITLQFCAGSELTVKLFCLDPSGPVRAALEKGRAAVLFSATLLPMDYYRDVLGGRAHTHSFALNSPFDPAHLGLFVAHTVSTRYADRNASVHPICALLRAMVDARAGHYIAYFPSYAYMEAVFTEFTAQYPDIATVRQERGMDDAARAAFLDRFVCGGETLLGFCVLGGIYAEGIDLTGDRLIGTAIVGVGLPQVGAEPDALRDYYNAQNGAGFDFAYRFPGMNKVLQAAGRVIRTETDRGVVLLIDDRFNTAAYRALFPPHWRGARRVTEQTLPAELAAFWAQTKGLTNPENVV